MYVEASLTESLLTDRRPGPSDVLLFVGSRSEVGTTWNGRRSSRVSDAVRGDVQLINDALE
jgi:hypothetical protein